MPKVSVFVPDAMYVEIRRRGLPISQIAQHAFADALSDDANADWIAAARSRPLCRNAVTTEDLMAAVDDEFGS